MNFWILNNLIIGGASKEETDSGLFIYSKIPFINIKTKNEIVNSDNNNEIDKNNGKIVMKESWNFNENKFEWKDNEDLISNPRIISQVSVLVWSLVHAYVHNSFSFKKIISDSYLWFLLILHLFFVFSNVVFISRWLSIVIEFYDNHFFISNTYFLFIYPYTHLYLFMYIHTYTSVQLFIFFSLIFSLTHLSFFSLTFL